MTAVQSYTVEEVVSNDDRPDKGNGPMRSIRMKFAGAPEIVEWYTRATTNPPQPGTQLVGTVESSQYGLKFKKAQQQGGGGPRPEDPKRAARIQRMHSQTAAIELAQLAHAMGVLPKPSEQSVKALWVEVVKPMADALDKDAKNAEGAQ